MHIVSWVNEMDILNAPRELLRRRSVSSCVLFSNNQLGNFPVKLILDRDQGIATHVDGGGILANVPPFPQHKLMKFNWNRGAKEECSSVSANIWLLSPLKCLSFERLKKGLNELGISN